MAKSLYVGNISFDMTRDELQELFEAYGEVNSVNLITDRNTGQPRGFAFVEMATDEDADAATVALDGRQVKGRTLRVSEARPPAARGGGDRGGGRGGDRGGGGGRGGDRGGGRGGDWGDRGGDRRRW